MEQKGSPLTNTCNFAQVTPIMMALPYPEIQVKGKNPAYANLLGQDYCGAVSELSAIAQYIDHEVRLSCDRCPVAKTLLGIAMAEMIHLQKLGELICLLGGSVGFSARQRDGRQKMWTPEYVNAPEELRKMLMVNIEGEKAAIRQYQMHMKMINDPYVNGILARIIKDEEYHILLLQAML